MVNWILIIIVFFILAIIFIKFEHARKRFKWILVAIFIAFLLISGAIIISKANVPLNSVEGAIKATTLYFSWLYNAAIFLWDSGSGVVKTVGNAINLNSTSAGFGK